MPTRQGKGPISAKTLPRFQVEGLPEPIFCNRGQSGIGHRGLILSIRPEGSNRRMGIVVIDKFMLSLFLARFFSGRLKMTLSYSGEWAFQGDSLVLAPDYSTADLTVDPSGLVPEENMQDSLDAWVNRYREQSINSFKEMAAKGKNALSKPAWILPTTKWNGPVPVTPCANSTAIRSIAWHVPGIWEWP